MKKLLFLFTLSLLMVSMAWGQVYLINEGFESTTFPPTGWTNSTSGAIRSTNSARTGLASMAFNGVSDAIYTPQLSNPNQLSFWYRRSSNATAWTLNVQVSTDAENWTSIGTVTNATTTYQEFTSDLSSYSDIYIRLLDQRSAGTHERYVDDFTVTAVASTPTINVSTPTLSGFTYVVDEGPSDEQNFTVSGSNLTANISISAPTNYEISTGTGVSFSATSPITLTQSGGTVIETPIYVRLKAGLASGDYIADQNVTASSGEASASVSLSGRVIELFDIPYSNDFRSLTDNNIASLQGFVISNAQNETGSGGYLRIFNGGYIETPSIDFADHDYLYVKFSSTTYGGAASQVLSLKLTIDNGITYDVLETYPITTEYINYSALVDISGIASNGMLKIEMTGGTNSTRFRDFSISVANATESQLIPTGHAVQTPPFGSTGVSLLLSSVTTSGSIEVSFFEDAPVEVSFEDGQAPLNYSTYRWTIDGGSVVFSNGHLRIETAGLPGVSDPNFLDIYHRSSAGSGVFTKLETVNANGVLSAPISSFSEFILGNREGGDNTLPVELSTFTVALNNYNNAVLTWVTQTETGVSGFYVFRNTEESLATAEMVSNLIPATNTSQQQVYLFTDKELGGPGTYYYWLQVSDMDGSDNFYGPITLVYQGGNEPGIPSIPQVTELKSIYPNPFNPSTTISYGLAEAADVKVQIFNSRGQLVRSISEGQRNAGNYNLIWNGTDNNGQSQPTGVYFVRLHAGKKVFNSKAVLMK